MKHLVIGGTGTVGSQVVRELLARGEQVRVLTRKAEKTKQLQGVETRIGDLLDPATLKSAFPGNDGVFILNPVSTTETHEGLMAVNGAMAAGVKRIVYMSVHHADAAPHIPHFASKIPVETAVKDSGIPYTILRPNNFFQNDLWFKDTMLQFGVYPQPVGDVGLSRVDRKSVV